MIEKMAHRFSRWAVALATAGVLVATGPLARAQSADDDSGWDVGADAQQSDSASDSATEQDAKPAPAPDESKSVASTQYSDTDPSALTDFRPTLDPYGAWVKDPTYGLVWVPSTRYVGSGFAPYVTSGHWGLTASGDWIWVSDYPFGWVVFHYGRWVWISGTGWAWIPGRRYANAWVVWRVPDDGYDYIGWAPMPPAWGWYDGFAVSLWFGPPVPYVFCESDYVFYPHVYRHIVHDRRDIDRIAHHSSRYHGYGHGPSPHRAHVPAHAVPSHHTAANPRAVAASRPSPYRMGGSGHSRPAARPRSASASVPHRLDHSRTLSSRPGQSSARRLSGPSYSAQGATVPSRSLQSQRPAPVRVPSRSTGSASPSRSVPSPSYRVPSYRSSPSRSYSYGRSYSYRPSPSRSYSPHYSSSSSSSSRRYTTSPSHPSYSAPRRSAPSFHSSPPMHFHSAPRGGFHGRR